ncbi:hypothetical protein HYFRA_00001595 [Hymenoscyphus fraxineus]|uniref:Amine oxidase n=1 Tax=Hymenoscyphus fraxineus TaxID=746836 RepID=A0A9N9PXT8_9HELO|nr:hypothetical protein HYFRA_00001595 [Hymenoscyphus fraxineus]
MFLRWYSSKFLLFSIPLLFNPSNATPVAPAQNGTCRTTKVAVLGAGMAGIAAAQALHNASISDFLIIDVNDYIGGRVKHTTFGKNSATGEPFVVELGANWIQGLGSPGGPENPIWTLVKKWGVRSEISNYSRIETFDENGAADYMDKMDVYDTSYVTAEQDAGRILIQNRQDRTMRTGLSIADWKPKKDMKAQAVEWWKFDWEFAYAPELSSQTFTTVAYNSTFYQFSDENSFVIDQRGFNYFIKSEAYTFLQPNDPRLLLSKNVTSITYSPKSVTVSLSDGSCVTAEYAICTFSLGVLQNDVVAFDPPLPAWKQEGIEGMAMGTYTKIFLQFPPAADGTFFWEHGPLAGTEYFLYADPTERGWYPVWQSLTPSGFIPGSGIFFVTVVYAQSYIVEAQDDETTKREVMDVLKRMFGEDIPEPLDFMYPRWSLEPWVYGSFSNWPPGLSLETHQNFRANLGRLWFAGEATSVGYFGWVHGAYTEGQLAANTIAGCLTGNSTICKDRASYETIRGCTTGDRMRTPVNGFNVDTMQTWGFGD